MSLFLVTLGYLGIHLAAFRVLFLPRWQIVRTERGILLYHVASFLLANGGVAVAIALRRGLGIEWLIFTFAAHGIYSLSFLELWSLTQGSYSLSVLAEIDRLGTAASETRLEALADIGRGKSRARTSDLARLGLRHSDGGTLTPAGKILAWICRAVLIASHGRVLNR